MVNINARGIKGTIKFITVDETSTRIVVDLTGLEGVYIYLCVYICTSESEPT